MPEEENVKYTKPRQTTNRGPQQFVPPLRWVIHLLGRWVLPIFSLYIPLFWVLWFIYGWQGFIIHDFLFPSFPHVFFKSKLHRLLEMFSCLQTQFLGPLLAKLVIQGRYFACGYVPQQHQPCKLDMDGKWSLNSFMFASSQLGCWLYYLLTNQ